jgi:hypothetical protein
MELLALLQGVFTPEWLSSQLTTNSFLITGIFGALMYALRGIPAKVAYFINQDRRDSGGGNECLLLGGDSLYRAFDHDGCNHANGIGDHEKGFVGLSVF